MKKIIIVLLGAIVLLNSCMWHNHRVKGNKNVVTESKQVDDFTSVELHTSYDVYLSEGSPASVKIEGEENIIPHIKLHVLNGVLMIETDDNIWMRTYKPVKIYVTSPSYNNVQVNSSGNIIGQTKITNETKLGVSVSGSGELKLDVDAPEIEANISGSGEIHLSGETKKVTGDVTGSGRLKAMDLRSEEAELQVTGSGDIDVYASIKLEANVAGSGNIRYKGDAQVTKNISGSGEVKKID